MLLFTSHVFINGNLVNKYCDTTIYTNLSLCLWILLYKIIDVGVTVSLYSTLSLCLLNKEY